MKKLLIIMMFTISTLSYSYGQCINCENTQTSGSNSSAIGFGTKALESNSFASGDNSEASGITSTALGYFSKAEGNYSFATGYNSYALGDLSFAIGQNANALHVRTYALGTSVLSSYTGAFTIGSYLEANAAFSMVIGKGYNEDNKLVNNHYRSLMIGFDSKKPTLFISPSPLSAGHNSTGKVGIGIAGDSGNPLLAKLHIRSDDNESANLFLEPTNWTSEFNAEIWLGNQAHGISAEVNQGLVFKTENYYLFNQGNMGIGTPEPCSKLQVTDGDIFIEDINSGIIMKSPDGNCWRISIDNNGNFVSTSITCPCNSANVPEQKNNQEINIYPNPVQNIVNIEIISQKSKYFNIEIYTIQGKLIFLKQYKTSPLSIDISDLSNGIYMLKIKDENGNIIKNEKIVKN